MMETDGPKFAMEDSCGPLLRPDKCLPPKTDNTIQKGILEEDTLGFEGDTPKPRTDEELLSLLIKVDDDMGEDDMEAFRFLCRDVIPFATLKKCDTGLDVFRALMSNRQITYDNLDFLLECFGRMHRYDLVKKLGLDSELVRTNLAGFKKLFPFRVLLFDFAEELGEKDVKTIQFMLEGRVGKRNLRNVETSFQLMTCLEQEQLLLPNRANILQEIANTVNRADLLVLVETYTDRGHRRRVTPGQPLLPRTTVNTSNPSPALNTYVRLELSSPMQGGQLPQGIGPGVRVDARGGQQFMNRSTSDGTLTVTSEKDISASLPGQSAVVIPDDLLWTISQQISDRLHDVALELNLTANETETLIDQNPDSVDRQMFQLLRHWRDRKVNDQGAVGQILMMVLTKLDFKTVAQNINVYLQELNRRGQDGNPEVGNNYTSLTEAPVQSENVQQRFQPEYADQIRIQQNMANMYISPTQTLGGVPGPQFQPQDVPMTFDPRAGLIPQQTPREPSPFNQPAQNQQEVFPEYPMTRKPRGICVIINNTNFAQDRRNPPQQDMKPRQGTEKDRDSLEYIFKKLGFKVRIHEDLADTEMMQALINVTQNIDHTNYDCFVCCILTHGVIGHLFGSNSNLISIKDLTSTFQANRCPSLAGKPKLFFFQACQGRDKMGGGKLETDGTQQLVETDGDRDYVPNEADFLLGYATVPGYVSFRSRNHGSWYIRKLVQMLDEHSHNQDLMSILIKVNEEVSCADANMEGSTFKQIPAPLVTLRKKLYFR